MGVDAQERAWRPTRPRHRSARLAATETPRPPIRGRDVPPRSGSPLAPATPRHGAAASPRSSLIHRVSWSIGYHISLLIQNSITRDLSYEVYEAKKDLEGKRKRVSYSSEIGRASNRAGVWYYVIGE